MEEASAGDIVALTGIADANISDTIADADNPEALPTLAIEEPTLKMTFGVNTSPFAGREGKFSTSRQLRARLYRELETNVSLRVEDGSSADEFIVSGRGELHLSILIETMRREGYELQVSRPEVITHDDDGKVLEPIERLVIDTREKYIGAISETLAIAQGAHGEHGLRWPGQRPAGVRHPDARADRLPQRVPDADAGQRRDVEHADWATSRGSAPSARRAMAS